MLSDWTAAREQTTDGETDMFGHFGHVNFFVITGQNGGDRKEGRGGQIRLSSSKVRVRMDENTWVVGGVLPFSVLSCLIFNIYFSS